MHFPDGFDPQPRLTGPTLSMTPLTEAELVPLREAAADPLIWEQHPSEGRETAEVFDPYARWLLEQGGTMVLWDGEGVVSGCSRFYPAQDVAGSVAIGFTFLARRLWGGAANREMKRMMLEHAFQWVDEVWLHIAPENYRSQEGTKKLGAVLSHEVVMETSSASPMLAFRLTKDSWRRTEAGIAG